MWEAPWIHGQAGVYGVARGEMGYWGPRLQDRGGVHSYLFGDDVFCAGGHSYESLFLLPLCKVGVDVVKDVGGVGVQASAREGLR